MNRNSFSKKNLKGIWRVVIQSSKMFKSI